MKIFQVSSDPLNLILKRRTCAVTDENSTSCWIAQIGSKKRSLLGGQCERQKESADLNLPVRQFLEGSWIWLITASFLISSWCPSSSFHFLFLSQPCLSPLVSRKSTRSIIRLRKSTSVSGKFGYTSFSREHSLRWCFQASLWHSWNPTAFSNPF